LVASNILKVIYAPHKAFKDILLNPRYLGAFILLIIFVVLQVGSAYVVASHSNLEQTMPTGTQGDVWTENAAMWRADPGVNIMNNTVDYLNSSAIVAGGPAYFGSTSVEFTASNVSAVRMELDLSKISEQVDCGSGGFKNVSLRVKIVAPDAKPTNVSLYLNSLNASSFYYDLTEAFSNSTVNVWNNITIPVGSGPWISSGNTASWENITGVKMEFIWPSNSNLGLRLDGLFFGGKYATPLVLYGDAAFLAQAALNGVAPFIFEWIILTAVLYLIIKMLKGNLTWKPLMVAVGFALVVLVIQAVIFALLYLTLPNLYYPLAILAGIPGESTAAFAVISDQIALITLISSVVQVAAYLWTVGLGAIITHDITGLAPDIPPFGWGKSVIVSGASFLVTLLVTSFLLGV
jgi:hypothetical protein